MNINFLERKIEYLEKQIKHQDRLIQVNYIIMVLFIGITIYFYNELYIKGSDKDYYDFVDQMLNLNDSVLVNRYELIAQLTQNSNNNVDYYMNDYYYTLPNYEMIKSYVNHDITNTYEYIHDRNDCDDFAFIFYGNFLKLEYYLKEINNSSISLGIGYVKNMIENSGHVLNVFLDNKYNLYCIETQSDKIELCSDLNNYKLKTIII